MEINISIRGYKANEYWEEMTSVVLEKGNSFEFERITINRVEKDPELNIILFNYHDRESWKKALDLASQIGEKVCLASWYAINCVELTKDVYSWVVKECSFVGETKWPLYKICFNEDAWEPIIDNLGIKYEKDFRGIRELVARICWGED